MSGPTRIELLHSLAHRLNKTPPPNMDSATEARLAGYLNQRQRRLLTMPGLARLRDATITFTSVPDRAEVALPHLAKVKRIFERTNDRTLYEMSQQDYRRLDPNPMRGTPEAYVWTGRQVVARQPAPGSAIFVKSSHGDDNTMQLSVEGVLDSGYPQRTVVTLSGTAPQSVPPAWARIDKLYLSALCVGDIDVYETPVAGPPNVSLAWIPAGQWTSVYDGLTLWPTPSDAITYYADITRVVTDLLHPTDQTPLPDDFADVLVLGALADEYQHLSDPRWTTAMTEYKERENQLKYWLSETAAGRPFALTGGWQKGSQLGPWFESGT